MAEEADSIATGQSDAGGDEDVSWEDAFKEASAESGEGALEQAPPPPALTERPLTDVGPTDPGAVDLSFLLDLSLKVTVEIGRTEMQINDLLSLGQGSVIELTKLVGEPFEVFVNEKLMARGEVVTVNERFGVRLTDIIDPKERIQQLG